MYIKIHFDYFYIKNMKLNKIVNDDQRHFLGKIQNKINPSQRVSRGYNIQQVPTNNDICLVCI
ncbi:hypothetical protein EJT82_17035 [Salmonella enterica]|nr:hypothetical protein [Salmonella enterica]